MGGTVTAGDTVFGGRVGFLVVPGFTVTGFGVVAGAGLVPAGIMVIVILIKMYLNFVNKFFCLLPNQRQ